MRQISTDNRSFKAFRLEIGASILRNNAHISSALTDIGSHQHIIELCDTYAMRCLVTWLGTKYGCGALPLSISQEKPHTVSPAERIFLSADIYPFNLTVDLRETEDLRIWANAFLDAAFEPAFELIGSFHEHLTSYILAIDENGEFYIPGDNDPKYGRRKKGQFYTPSWVVDYCLENSLRQDLPGFMKSFQRQKDMRNDAIPISVLDPACGTGNFLLGVLRLLERNGADWKQLLSAAKYSLHGRDLDGKAVSLAICSVLLYMFDYIGRRMASPLLSPDSKCMASASSNPVSIFDLEETVSLLKKNIHVTDSVYDSFVEKSKLGKFDLVITNPPYISFGSRNQDKLLASTASFLRKHFPVSAEYKIRLNSLFQEVALNYVKEGGKICLLIPNGFLTGKGYAKLRANLLEKTRIVSFTELPEDTIKGAVVGRWCVAIYERFDQGREGLEYPIELVSFCHEAQERPTTYKMMASRLVTRDQSRFRLVFQSLDEQLSLKLEQLPPLSAVLRGHTGIRARTGQKSILSDTAKTDLFKKGIKSGSQVTAYTVEWDGTWLKIDPRILFSGGFDPRVVENPKIMMRQTADKIVAAFDDSGLYHLNNVHSFSPQLVRTKNDQPDDAWRRPYEIGEPDTVLHFFVALMNSRLWLYLYRLKTREDGRALAQIDIETIEAMPIPNYDAALFQEISRLGREIGNLNSDKQSAGLRKMLECQASIDRLIYQAYGLSEREITHVQLSRSETLDEAPALR